MIKFSHWRYSPLRAKWCIDATFELQFIEHKEMPTAASLLVSVSQGYGRAFSSFAIPNLLSTVQALQKPEEI
ncbi:hypothetical protein [Desulfosporosinus lacus]|uniref:Uncharacterized protein n=1 Tax=Desulfosporosinus lacus DSM 15449 TaxID=1121420 RepID=A0A1M5X904_9FIRM|nr:hypothetical protein [Desulfosporosinus lacus]SHH95994.1 hypothetical protein SAMN02746098_01853 [Desulfosporosinus lacus DSM 15449]